MSQFDKSSLKSVLSLKSSSMSVISSVHQLPMGYPYPRLDWQLLAFPPHARYSETASSRFVLFEKQ